MNEELQKQLIAALQALREGAPDAWEQLIADVVARETIYVNGMVVGCVFLFFACLFLLWRLHVQEEEWAITSMWAVVALMLLGLPVGMLIQKIGHLASPSLTLLEMIR